MREPTSWAGLRRDLERLQQTIATMPPVLSEKQVRARARQACAAGCASLDQVLLIRPNWVAEYQTELDQWAALASVLLTAPWPIDKREHLGFRCSEIDFVGGYTPDQRLPDVLTDQIRSLIAWAHVDFERWANDYVLGAYPKPSDWQIREAYRSDVAIAALLGDEHGLAYRQRIWTKQASGWVLRAEVREAGHRHEHRHYHDHRFAGFLGRDLKEAIRTGRLNGTLIESMGGVHCYLVFTNTDLADAIERHGWDLGASDTRQNTRIGQTLT